jgi:hypothetical protein
MRTVTVAPWCGRWVDDQCRKCISLSTGEGEVSEDSVEVPRLHVGKLAEPANPVQKEDVRTRLPDWMDLNP